MTTRWTPARRHAAAASTAIALAAVAACAPDPGTDDGEPAESPAEDATITIGVEAGSPWETFYKKASVEFTEDTGIEVEFLAIPHANMRQQFLSDAIAGEGAYDVYTVDQPWMPEFATKGYLLSLDDKLSDEERADFLPHTLDTVTYDGELYAIPYMVHNTVLYYRTDLFEAAGIDGPPTTWEEYREYARQLTDQEKGVWGTMIPGKQDGEVATRFQSFLQQTGSDIADDEGNPTIDTPEADSVFELMTAIQFEDKSSPPGLHDLTDIQGQFLEGKLAMAPVWPYLYSLASDPGQSKVVDKFAIAISPGNPDQVSTTFSWGFGVSAASKNPDAAWEWIKWATSSPLLERLSRDQVTPVPRQSVMDALADDTSLSERERHAFEVFGESVARSTTIPMTPAYPQFQEAIAVAVSSVMSESKDPKSALAEAQAAMEAAAAELSP